MAYVGLKDFKMWCQKVLPLVYDESLSYYEVLCKMCDYINNMISNQDYFNDVLEELGGDVGVLQEQVQTIQDELNKIKNGEYMSEYIQALESWIDRNLQELVGRVVKYVMFGLSTDGHFVAYIPPTWDFMEFDTIIDPTSELYGHLILKW